MAAITEFCTKIKEWTQSLDIIIPKTDNLCENNSTIRLISHSSNAMMHFILN
ncbi:hypothetical protein DPMN_066711 [Dreissena polymorpha]|uniref:Uncharacterized protein n=1 Tax=Dreissena polymorpha TaxID=45954 RepID=A0A9D3YU05_DREPO|nr:hypothetical protein DPMN_066711 [Dreissena polymorpha]